MHELSIAMSIVELAEEYAGREGATKVRELELEVGELSGVVIEALDFAMEEATSGTLCEGAHWTIRPVPAEMKCRACGHQYFVHDLFTPCPECGTPGGELLRGDEMRLHSILVE